MLTKEKLLDSLINELSNDRLKWFTIDDQNLDVNKTNEIYLISNEFEIIHLSMKCNLKIVSIDNTYREIEELGVEVGLLNIGNKTSLSNEISMKKLFHVGKFDPLKNAEDIIKIIKNRKNFN